MSLLVSNSAPRPHAPLLALLVTVALGSMLAPLNSTMIAVALPSIAGEFRAPATGWLVTAYLILTAALLPVAGKLGDRWGRRPLLLVGFAVSIVATMGAALAPSFPILVACRLLQAVSAPLIGPNGAALLREILPAEQRARYFGLIGAAVSVAAASGPAIGGFAVAAGGWRAMFLVNLLLILPGLLLGWLYLPAGGRPAASRPFDLPGAALLMALLGYTAAWAYGLVPAPLWLAGLLLAAGLTAFVALERRQPDPVVQPRFFRKHAFAAANAGHALGNLAMYNLMLVVPLLLHRGGEHSEVVAGLVTMVMPAANVLAAPAGGYLADRLGRRWPVIGGYTIMALGAGLLYRLGAPVSIPLLTGCMVLVGLGLGLGGSGQQTAALEAVGREQSGSAAGIYSTSRYVGSIVGTSLMGALLAARGEAAYPALYALMLGASLLALFVSLGLPGQPVGE